MARRKDDGLDMLIRKWAEKRREILGWTNPRHAWEALGAPHCTLSEVRDHYDGAGSKGTVTQHFPEVYTGINFHINRAFNHMPPTLREIMDVHYVVDRTPVKLKVHRLGIKWSDYWGRVEKARQRVDSWICCVKDSNVQTK